MFDMDKNHFCLFPSPRKASTPYDDLLSLLDDLVREYQRQHRKYLLTYMKAAVLKNPTLLALHRTHKRFTTKSYLNQLIDTLPPHPHFTTIKRLFTTVHKTYQIIKLRAEEYAAYSANNPTESTQELAKKIGEQMPKDIFFRPWRERFLNYGPPLPTADHISESHKRFNPKQQAWQQIVTTLKLCVNNQTSRSLVTWHPLQLDYYYPAKLRLQWQYYEKNYESININNLSRTIAKEIVLERKEAVKKIFLSVQKKLLKDEKTQFHLTRLRKAQEKMGNQKDALLETISTMAPAFKQAAEEAIHFATCSLNTTIQATFKQAIAEAKRPTHPLNTKVGFNLFTPQVSPTPEIQEALIALEKSDNKETKETYLSLFIIEADKIEEMLQTHHL